MKSHPIDRLFKDYKKETKRMTGKDKEDVWSFIEWMIAFTIMTVLFGYDVKWLFGRHIPFAINFLFIVVSYGIFKKYSPRAITLTFVVSLLLIYSGVATPFLHLG